MGVLNWLSDLPALMWVLAAVYIFLDGHYWVRMFATLLVQQFLPRVSLNQPVMLYTACLPTDLDLSLHMNNARYLREMDFGRWSWCVRVGLQVLLIAVVMGAAASSGGHLRSSAIIRQTQIFHPDGSYEQAYETENGIRAEERSYLVLDDYNRPSYRVEGMYTYMAPDNTLRVVTYEADRNGYRPVVSKLSSSSQLPAADYREAVESSSSQLPAADYRDAVEGSADGRVEYQ